MRIAVAVLALASCGGDRVNVLLDAPVDAGPHDEEVLKLAVTIDRDVDVLFVIDDSPNMAGVQANLRAAFPSLTNAMSAGATLPNVHIGVVTTDLGTSADDGTQATAIPRCMGFGQNGNLQTYGTTSVTGNFISDIAASDGTRQTNYTGTLTDAFGMIAAADNGGCDYVQPLAAANRALANNPANAGFLRPSANLAVIIVSDQDDCSMHHSTLLGGDSALGPLQPFRCTQFGVTCSTGGATTDAMAMVGPKSSCHSNEQSAYLAPVAGQVAQLKGLKSDPSTIVVASLTGNLTPFSVELRPPPGGGTAIPALAHSCTASVIAGDPGVRTAAFASQFDHFTVQSVCDDMTTTLAMIGGQVANLTGSTCVFPTLVLPPSCTVTQQVGLTLTTIPACPQSGVDCWQLVTDATCPGQHFRFMVQRTQAPPPDAVISVHCIVQ